MAHFAKLDENNKVINVVKVKDNECVDSNGGETDNQGQNFLRFVSKEPNSIWKRCSYNTMYGKHLSGDASKVLRGNYPCVNYTYDEALDLFLPPKPYPSWILHTEEDLINENGVVGIRKYEWKSPTTPVGTPDGTDIPYLQTWDENQLTWTAYMANDNEIQYIWNKATSVWETV